MSRVVLSLCDRTGNMIKPWLDAGYSAITVDLQDAPTSHPQREHWRQDVREFRFGALNPLVVFAFPPCTDLAVSGARWFREKGSTP